MQYLLLASKSYALKASSMNSAPQFLLPCMLSEILIAINLGCHERPGAYQGQKPFY